MAWNKHFTRIKANEMFYGEKTQVFGFGDNGVATDFFAGTVTLQELMQQLATGLAEWQPEPAWMEERLEELNVVGRVLQRILETHQDGDTYEFTDENDWA